VDSTLVQISTQLIDLKLQIIYINLKKVFVLSLMGLLIIWFVDDKFTKLNNKLNKLFPKKSEEPEESEK